MLLVPAVPRAPYQAPVETTVLGPVLSFSTASPEDGIVVTTRKGELVARCTGSCRLPLPEGAYRLSYTRGGEASSPMKLVVTRPADYRVEPPDDTAATSGLVMGILGPASILVGSYMFLAHCIGEGDSECTELYTVVGGSVMLSGIIMTPIGWTMYGVYRKPTLERAEPGKLRVGVNPSREGASLSISGTF